MEKIRVGIIGTGIHGSRYARHILHDIEGLELTAISRRSSEGEKQALDWGTAYHKDFRDLINDSRVDAVVAVTFPTLNLAIAELCVKAGKPLLLEKPLGADSSSAAKIVQLFSDSGLKLTVGQTLRYNSVITSLRDNLPRIGKCYCFSANQRLEPSTLDWHGNPELAGAGVSFHTAVHIFDALRFVTGLEVARVMALSARHQNSVLEDLLTVLVEMENGVQGTVDCSKVGQARSGRFEFVGSEGQLYGEQVHSTLELVQGTTIQPLEFPKPTSTIKPLLRDWRDFLNDAAKNPISGQDGLVAVKICEACLESARLDSWVPVR